MTHWNHSSPNSCKKLSVVQLCSTKPPSKCIGFVFGHHLIGLNILFSCQILPLCHRRRRRCRVWTTKSPFFRSGDMTHMILEPVRSSRRHRVSIVHPGTVCFCTDSIDYPGRFGWTSFQGPPSPRECVFVSAWGKLGCANLKIANPKSRVSWNSDRYVEESKTLSIQFPPSVTRASKSNRFFRHYGVV